MKTAYFLLNEECNLNCIHCIRGKRSKNSLVFSDYAHIIDELESNFSNSLLVLTGGEPSLNKYVYEILNYAEKKNFMKIMFLSNCTTDTIVPIVYKFGKSPNIIFQFSIDGDCNEHNKMRGEGTFELIFENIQRINSFGVSVYISSVVTRQNIFGFKKLHDKLIKYDISQWHINPVQPFGHTDNSLLLKTEEWNNFVTEIRNYSKIKLSIHKMYDFSKLINCSENDILKNREMFEYSTNCMTVKNKIYIYPDGTVYGCTCLKDFPLGNIFSQSLQTILESKNSLMLKNYVILKESPCYNCKYIPICNGGCIGMSYHTFNMLGMGDNRCPLFQKSK